MLKAPVNKIIPFSNVDGPGNRTSIFLQSCPFRCYYCHNPETINMCNHCGDCVDLCPVHALSIKKGKVVWDSTICVDCDTCIKTCKYMSSPKIKEMTVKELLVEISKQKGFIRGITVSGGECMNHAEFLLELFKKAKKEGYSCLIDSNGIHDFSKYEELLDLSDGVMLDVKAYDDQFHEYLTGASNKQVQKNLNYLLKKNKLVEVRTVLLPNSPKQNEITVTEVSKIIQDKTLYKLLRYRPFGVREEGIKEIGNTITTEKEANKLAKKAIQLGAKNTVVV
ncbi:YjjW family glycine radical enzyme activase [Anaerorhabdus furcosa]|uniref:Pyruvate formate lyase activating enzyme n=1 Tax=Anaerorhabdus furcosa TaxID=118967 RepID=A0A1T4L391_9FIRM|nr:YjjW family glycine radical enzyme activase [Anaerorhabdus furcosa]SJZ49174.1 pyruvate formate lyase activating enzyme [Anaerorhabdus furcosa]